MSLNHQKHFRINAPVPYTDDDDVYGTHIKRFVTGRYSDYVLRTIRPPYDDYFYCDWFRPGAKESVDPPLDIQDSLELWSRATTWHSMSPVEFVYRMYCNVP